MIGRIKGILLEKEIPILLVDIGGVGYEVHASMQSFCRLPNIGVEVTLHTHLIVREDAQILYGFITKEERALFLALIKVSGIGPKSALAILSSIEPEEFIRCVLEDNLAGLLRLPGIGKKTAQRLLIEMRDKLSGWEITSLPTTESSTGAKEKTSLTRSSTIHDAISALISLGYNQNEARRVILQHKKPDMTSEDLIRVALKELAN